MPTYSFFSPTRVVEEEIVPLQQTLAVLEILERGLNDPINETHLYAWRDIADLVLQYEVEHLQASIDRLCAWIAEHGKEGTI